MLYLVGLAPGVFFKHKFPPQGSLVELKCLQGPRYSKVTMFITRFQWRALVTNVTICWWNRLRVPQLYSDLKVAIKSSGSLAILEPSVDMIKEKTYDRREILQEGIYTVVYIYRLISSNFGGPAFFFLQTNLVSYNWFLWYHWMVLLLVCQCLVLAWSMVQFNDRYIRRPLLQQGERVRGEITSS